MDLAPLQVATAGNAAVSAILAIALFYVWRLNPEERAPGYWAAALLLLALRQGLVLAAPGAVPPLNFVATVTAATSSAFFFAGARAFVGRPLAGAPVVGTLLVLGLLAGIAALEVAPRPITLLPGTVMVAGLTLLTGLTFLRSNREQPDGCHAVIGGLFCALTLVVAVYPFFGESPDSRALYAIPTTALFVAIAINLIIIIQRQRHLRTLEAQRALEAANRRFNDIVDVATAWIWELDVERRVTFISNQVYDSLGIRPEILIGHRFRDVPGIASLDVGLEEAARLFRPHAVFDDLRVSVATATGRRADLLIRGKAVHDSAGRHVGYRGLTVDITELNRSRTLLSATMAAVADAVGPAYFRLLVRRLTSDLGVDYALVGRIEGGLVHTLAAFGDHAHQPDMAYPLAGTPCAGTVAAGEALCAAGVAQQFPADRMLGDLRIEGYAGTALRNAAGEVIGLVAIMSRSPLRDGDLVQAVLTAVAPRAGAELERQIAETTLREREELFRTVVDHLPSGFHLKDRSGRFLIANRRVEEWFCGDRHLILGKSPDDIAAAFPGLDAAQSMAEHNQVVQTGRAIARERTITSRDGRKRDMAVVRFALFDRSGAVAQVGALFTDVTDLRAMAQQIRDNEALFRTVIDHMPIGFHLVDTAGRITMANHALEAWYGFSRDHLLDRTHADISRPVRFDGAAIDAEIREVFTTRRPMIRERFDRMPDGSGRPVLVCRYPVEREDGSVEGVATLLTDLSDLRRLENAVLRSEARLQRIVSALDRSGRGIVVEDAEQRAVYVNRTAEELLGPSASAVRVMEHAGTCDALEPGGTWSGEVIHETPAGRDVILDMDTSWLADGSVVTVVADVTGRLERERRQAELERQVQEAQKMDAVGQLAGGIAHDFNNLIGAILGFAHFVVEDTEAGSRVHGYAQRIVAASQRGRELIQQLLALARREQAPRRPVALTPILEESAQLLRATMPVMHRIEIRNQAPESWVAANATQLTQILVNLCLNAHDALGENPGTVTLALERAAPDEPDIGRFVAAGTAARPAIECGPSPDAVHRCRVGVLREGRRYVALSVRDDGAGIPPDVLERIFDPFFTTKPPGKGTGLGLPVVQRLVLAHEGALLVTTEAGAGTTFRIYLPEESPAGETPARAVPAPGSGRYRVLVVDDDVDFGDMVSTAIDRAGYEVAVCATPGEALDVVRGAPELWDVVITDQSMPQLSGLELIARLKALNPGLRCILCTGYASSGLNEAQARAGGADSFFHKPVETELLVAAVAAHLADLGRSREAQAPR